MESMFSSNRPGWAALLDEQVTAYLPDLKYIHDEPLARHTSFRIGGPATLMAFPTSGDQIVLLTGFAQELSLIHIYKDADKSLKYMRAFGEAGIEMNGQIVVCPGWNDGEHLRRSIEDLMDIGFNSCSIVPVGLTKFRKGLARLEPVTKEKAWKRRPSSWQPQSCCRCS